MKLLDNLKNAADKFSAWQEKNRKAELAKIKNETALTKKKVELRKIQAELQEQDKKIRDNRPPDPLSQLFR